MNDGKWFAVRRFGYGAGLPIRWQGWVVLAVLAAGLILAGRLDGAIRWVTIGLVLAATLPVMKARTVGGWRWHW